ncbi:ATPase, P-type (transporting), HAD superfamil y, subfamily IC [Peptoclostridium acidaminophilum DSM 3953]|uniref:P-type Ca(2+) transporter n=1 Tax=Peptoclostridium acidaminophilum DSM 3953 TaxID=1286171 RepID=W8TEV7_PEPAC|nr:cation-translocating P-type ATPase [Peptoclostridium acidaminophilum]AHM56363.1 ATPase, P-type (transporting), HAD superfamil y, subfamily IC [Peptoclostridium acidaminophilum DSM 3953]
MWFCKSKEEVLEEFKVSQREGLTADEAGVRLELYGENKLKAKPKKSLAMMFFAQLKDMLIYVLLGAAIITIAIGEHVDAVIILMVVVLNAVIGVIQEYKAEKAIEALQKMTAPKALVRRGGEVSEIDSALVVPGDIVLLDAGRFVPADMRLIETANLQIEESALTGESVPDDKHAEDIYKDLKLPIGDRTNMAYMSTLVTYGRGEGVVVATAMDTEIGKIASILDEDIEEMTPLQRRLAEFGRVVGLMAVGICGLIFAISVFQKRDLFEMFLTAISLAVAAIPEGLPAIVAIVLALGVTRMSKKNAIVKRLPAVETLGSVNIICSDKTGTLTQNRMAVSKLFTLGGSSDVPQEGENLEASSDELELIKTLVLCSDATYENGMGTGDPTEVALVILGERYGVGRKQLHSEHKRVGEKPFDSSRKLMSTLNEEAGGYRVNTKGAIDNILKISAYALVGGNVVPLTEEMRNEYLRVAEEMSDKALRVLGAAYKDVEAASGEDDMEHSLVVLGIVGMEDPPRLEVRDSIEKAKGAGITPVMITGDHKNTAVAIAKELGIADAIEQSITGAEIDELSDEALAGKISGYRVFARVSPEHKVRIVNAYRANGNIVSMTGDGVNDAPSLKSADIGVAMGITGTDVSKGASDMILTDDNFTTIVHAIEEGRNIYSNIRRSVIFLLSCNLGEVIVVVASVIFFWPVPLLPTQILWINLITDTFPAIALGVEPGDSDVMKKRPRDPSESFFAGGRGLRAVLGGSLIGALTLVAFYLGLAEYGYSLGSRGISEYALTYARTMAFVVLAASQLFYSITMRSSRKSIFEIGLFSNRFLVGAICLGLALQFAVVSIPFMTRAFKVQMLSQRDWGIVFLLAIVPLLANEIIKLFLRTGNEEI